MFSRKCSFPNRELMYWDNLAGHLKLDLIKNFSTSVQLISNIISNSSNKCISHIYCCLQNVKGTRSSCCNVIPLSVMQGVWRAWTLRSTSSEVDGRSRCFSSQLLQEAAAEQRPVCENGPKVAPLLPDPTQLSHQLAAGLLSTILA